MSPGDAAGGRLRPVDGVCVARARARLEAAGRAAWLHEEAARRMAGRLQLLRRAPHRVVDWWPHAGGSGPALAQALPAARIDAPVGVPRESPRHRWLRWLEAAASRAGRDTPAQADMVWANMLLHHVADPLELMTQWHRALAIGGILMFSTLGPGSLRALRDVYRDAGWGEPMAELVDMHDIGDMLVAAGFGDPVMDQEVVRLSWRTAEDALAELRSLGANAAPARQQGLRTPRWRHQLLARLAQAQTCRAPDGRIALEFEIVYGHAVRPPPRLAVAPEARIGVDDLRLALRRPRRPGAT